MKAKALGAIAALLFCVGGVAFGLDQQTVKEIQAKLAAQEARITDMQAKLAEGGGEEGEVNLTSLRKNATVTIGGLVQSRYTYTRAKVDSVYEVFENAAGDLENNNTNAYRRRADWRGGSLEVSDAELEFQIDVNDCFEAYINLDLHNMNRDDYAVAKAAYLNWKNLCDTGFSLKVGRDALVFGSDGFGELGSYAAGGGDGLSELDDDEFQMYAGMPHSGAGMAYGGLVPMHNGWDIDGVTQITPSWEGLDGRLSVEASLFQSVFEDEAWRTGAMYTRDRHGVRKFRSRNYGVGSFTTRIAYEPVENLKFTLSFGNYHSKGSDDAPDDVRMTKDNTIYGLAFEYTPCFFDRMKVWGQWVHGHNVYFVRGLKSDAFNFGASVDITDSLAFFAQGDYLRSKFSQGDNDSKGKAWAFYTGLQYNTDYGVAFEAGWKHERVTYRDHGERVARIKGNTVYALAAFEF